MAHTANRGNVRNVCKTPACRIDEALDNLKSFAYKTEGSRKSDQIAWAIDSVIAVGGIIPVDDMWKIVAILEEYKKLSEACEEYPPFIEKFYRDKNPF